MVKLKILTITFSFLLYPLAGIGASATQSQGKTVKIKLSKKWFQLTKLVDEEIKTIAKAGRLDAKLKYRLLELYAEKMALLKEKENKVFLAASAEDRKKKGQSYYYRNSLALYKKSLQFGNQIIKEHPRFKDVSHIYYTLGINSRDYAKDNLTEKYLHLALGHIYSNTTQSQALEHKIKTSLAEFYYNSKNYSRAISYYSDVLKNKEDSWYTKHMYNIGWCYFKVRNYDKAIELLKNSHYVGLESKKANNGKYISMSDQVMMSIGLFYIYAKKEKEGVDFYVKESESPVSDLIKMSKIASEHSGADKTKMIIKSALEVAKSHNVEKGHPEQVEVRLAELDLYRQFKDDDEYFKTANALQELNQQKELEESDREVAVTKIKELVGLMQVKLNRNSKKEDISFNDVELKRIISYFDILYSVDNVNAASYRFYQGETLFSVSHFAKASEYYRNGLEDSKKKEQVSKELQSQDKDKKTLVFSLPEELKLREKILNSLLATLAKSKYEKSVNKDTRDEYTIYAYTNYLNFWPKNETARQIYSKLFYLYLSLKKMDESIAVIDNYNAIYKEDIQIQRDMLTAVMDYYIKTRNSDQLAFWVGKLEKGHLSFDESKIEKATEVLGNILFEEYQKVEKEGKKEDAAKGYISLYEDKRYPKKVKARAALNASILFLELGTVPESYEWQIRAFNNFPKDEVLGQMSKVQALSQEYAVLQDFKHSAEISEYVLKNFCQDKISQRNFFYKNLITMRLLQEGDVNDNLKTAQRSLNQYKNCGVSSKSIVEMENRLFSHSLKFAPFKTTKSLANIHKENKEIQQAYLDTLPSRYWKAKAVNNEDLQKSALLELAQVKHPHEQKIRQFEHWELMANQMLTRSLPEIEVFDANMFNQALEKKALELKALNDQAGALLKSAPPEILLGVYRLLSLNYENMGHQLVSYTPQGVPADFVKGFKGQMKNFAKSFQKEAKNYFRLGKKAIDTHSLNTFYNDFFQDVYLLGKGKYKDSFGVRYPASVILVPMDTSKGAK